MPDILAIARRALELACPEVPQCTTVEVPIMTKQFRKYLAFSRTALPALAAEVERLTAELAAKEQP